MRTIYVGVFSLLFSSYGAAAPTDCLQGERAEKLKKIYDFNGDGCIDRKEQEVMRRDAGINPPSPPAPKVVTDPYAPQKVLLVRDAYPTKAFLSEGRKASDNGALFSYERDRVTNETTAAIKGSVSAGIFNTYEIKQEDLDKLKVHRSGFLLGVEADRKLKNRSPKDAGSTSAKAGFEVEAYAPWEFYRHYLKGDLVYTTDSGGAASVYGFESSWQPMAANWVIGRSATLSRALTGGPNGSFGDKIWIGFWPALAVDYFHVGDNGSFDALSTGKDYLWLGTKTTASLSFDESVEFLRNISFLMKYIYMPNVGSSSGSTINYRQFSAQYALFKDEQTQSSVSLEARYTRGNTPRTLSKTDDIYTGLTVKWGRVPGGAE